MNAPEPTTKSTDPMHGLESLVCTPLDGTYQRDCLEVMKALNHPNRYSSGTIPCPRCAGASDPGTGNPGTIKWSTGYSRIYAQYSTELCLKFEGKYRGGQERKTPVYTQDKMI